MRTCSRSGSEGQSVHKDLVDDGWRGHQVLQLEVEDALQALGAQVRSPAACPAGVTGSWPAGAHPPRPRRAPSGSWQCGSAAPPTRRGSCSPCRSAAEGGARCGVRRPVRNRTTLSPCRVGCPQVSGAAATDHLLPCPPLHPTQAEEPH